MYNTPFLSQIPYLPPSLLSACSSHLAAHRILFPPPHRHYFKYKVCLPRIQFSARAVPLRCFPYAPSWHTETLKFNPDPKPSNYHDIPAVATLILTYCIPCAMCCTS